ncbi:MAG: DUF1566 domain-containing protein [Spirochaetaceae bacterium]|jgi:hypothetical protein|nr:DUF1566 domain-containing protein [Spirochaetaceae bacterium]
MKKMFFSLLVLLPAMGAFAQEPPGQGLPRLAVVEFSTNVSTEKAKADSLTVRNLVESQMVATGKYQIVTRAEIDKLLNNQQIAVSDISSAENVKKLQLQNISYIVTGSVDAMDADYAVTVKILDVSTGEFSHSDNDFMGGSSRELYTGVNTLVGKFVAEVSSSGDRVTQSGASKIYKIGDFGPAGGIVFYDKGVFSAGWRYLEAAPVETEFTAQWGAYNKVVDGTGNGIGFGKRNTQAIVEFLRKQGETGRAAQRCADLDFDGFNDWFLPSKDELNLMYRNLKTKGLGEFSGSWYWSSSEYNNGSAWPQYFSDGKQSYGAKDYAFSVRAVRAF